MQDPEAPANIPKLSKPRSTWICLRPSQAADADYSLWQVSESTQGALEQWLAALWARGAETGECSRGTRHQDNQEVQDNQELQMPERKLKYKRWKFKAEGIQSHLSHFKTGRKFSWQNQQDNTKEKKKDEPPSTRQLLPLCQQWQHSASRGQAVALPGHQHPAVAPVPPSPVEILALGVLSGDTQTAWLLEERTSTNLSVSLFFNMPHTNATLCLRRSHLSNIIKALKCHHENRALLAHMHIHLQ